MSKRKSRRPHIRIPTKRIKWMPPPKAPDKPEILPKASPDCDLDPDGFHRLIRKE